MKLLENELILRYFGCRKHCKHFTSGNNSVDECMSYRILLAMQEPIKKGESWLELYGDGKVELNEGYDDDGFDSLHPYFLRLPDAFQQKRECEHTTGFYCAKCLKPMHDQSWCECKKPDPCTHNYGVMGVGCMPWCDGKPDPVELKIHKLAEYFRTYAAMREQPGWFRAELRELVELAKAKA